MSSRQKVDARKLPRPKPSERWIAYNSSSIAISVTDKLTTETRQQANLIFDEITPSLGRYKMDPKRAYCQLLFHTAKKAYHKNKYIRFSRKRRDKNIDMQLQVIDAMVEAGYFIEYRSPSGSPRMSRLKPTKKLTNLFSKDPWEYDPETRKNFVVLHKRDTKEEIGYDPKHPVAAEMQRTLAKMNRILTDREITYQPYSEWENDFLERRRLRPIYYAIFTDNFNNHGRIYTGKHGHQTLRKYERFTIQFDGEPSVEYDYSGLHLRMLYHLNNIEYTGDPYQLWTGTSEPARMLIKQMTNALINAKTVKDAINSCNFASYSKTKLGKRKMGNAGRKACLIREARELTDLSFSKLAPLILAKHERISHEFGNDRGVTLMRLDSTIALEMIRRFTRWDIPCLSCHDSFIVPEKHRDLLLNTMRRVYHRLIGFYPIIRGE